MTGMGALILLIFYGSIWFFVVVSGVRGTRYASAPLHVHWDLYKGSSVYESADWWTKSEDPFGRKLGSMAMDLLFLREFYHRNRKFWYPLYAFHLGLYLLVLWHLWLFSAAVLATPEAASSLGWAWGTFSTVLALTGAGGILWMRATDAELKVYYPPIHYLKWVVILLTLLGGMYAVDVHFQSSMPAVLKYVRAQVTFADLEHKLHPALGPALHVLFASAWLVYLPLGHVFQVFFRYYHYLRWDEVPNKPGNQVERRVRDLLERPVSWAGPHVPQGKRWREVASEPGPASGTGTR